MENRSIAKNDTITQMTGNKEELKLILRTQTDTQVRKILRQNVCDGEIDPTENPKSNGTT